MQKRSSSMRKKTGTASPLMVRLDEKSKEYLSLAAQLRQVSVSDYVRTVTIAQAKKEVLAAQQQTILLTPEEQLSFWEALSKPVKMTVRQRQLGKIMRGEA